MAKERASCRETVSNQVSLEKSLFVLFFLQAEESNMELQIWFQQNIRCFVQESFKRSLTISTLSVTSIVSISVMFFSELLCLIC